MDQVALHMGFIPGRDKMRLYTEEQLFHKDYRRGQHPRVPLAEASAAPAGGLRGAGTWAAAVGVPLATATGMYIWRLSRNRRR